MIILMKGLQEEKNVRRCISDFHDEPFCDRIIVIDGGSVDYTVQELRKFPKVEVFIHPWIDSYHAMEVCQSNIALSYIPQGELALIMDFDERMSDEMKETLRGINESPNIIPEKGIGHFSRRTFELMRYEDSPYAMMDEQGWPLISHQIGQYPDYQCRLIRKHFDMHWVNSPHHVLMGWNHNSIFDVDIVHYEKEDARDRERIEKKWARAQARRKELGLTADLFEATPKIEIAEYYEPESWK